MEHIKKAWNWRPGEKLRRSAGYTAARLLAGFAALMILCTLVSRAADSVTVPVVTADSPIRGSIVQRLYLSGMLEASGGEAVRAPASVAVTEVLAAEGDAVEEGDLLFTFDTEASAREIEAKRLSIEGIQAELAVLNAQKARQSDEDSTARQRADEDYAAVEEAQELILAQKLRAIDDAEYALRDYNKDTRGEEGDGTFTEEEHKRLMGVLEDAEIAYDQALVAREEALRRAERSIEDLSGEESPDSAAAIKTLELRREELALAALLEAVENDGNVYAPASGILSELRVEVGGLTTGEAAAIITDPGLLRFTARLTEEERELVEVGAPVELRLSGEQRTHGDMAVASIAPVPEEPDAFRLVVDVPAGIGAAGRSGELEIARRSRQYETCVPLSALYGVKDDYYVLGVREGESVLGPEYYAERIPVTLEEKNGVTAAVSGPLGTDSRLITASPRPIRDGDRIRLGNPKL